MRSFKRQHLRKQAIRGDRSSRRAGTAAASTIFQVARRAAGWVFLRKYCCRLS